MTLYISTLFYIYTFYLVWNNYCCDLFSYYGYTAGAFNTTWFAVTVVSILIPLFFYKRVLSINNFITIILFVFLYIPIQLAIYFIDYSFFNYKSILYMITLSVIQSSFFYVERIKIKDEADTKKDIIANDAPFEISENIFAVEILTVILFIYLLTSIRFRLSINSLASASEARADQILLIKSSFIGTGYVICWLSSLFCPIILTTGLFLKKYYLCFFIFLGYFCLYGCNTMKIQLFIPILIVLFYYMLTTEFFKKNLMSSVEIITSIICLLLLQTGRDTALSDIKSIFLQRTVAQQGLLFTQYVDFFHDHPNTYFSHINVVDYITRSYPYTGYSIGQMVHGGDSNSCAGFFALDGIASADYAGLIIISIIFFAFLFYIRYIEHKYVSNMKEVIFLCLVLTPSTMALCNSSFFTYLWTRGVIFIIIIIQTNFIVKKQRSYENTGQCIQSD